LSVGEVIEFPRPLGILRVPFPYNIEYFRGPDLPDIPPSPRGPIVITIVPFAGVKTTGSGNGGFSYPNGGGILNWDELGRIWVSLNPGNSGDLVLSASGDTLTSLTLFTPSLPRFLPGNKFKFVGMEANGRERYDEISGPIEDSPGESVATCFSWGVALGLGPGIPLTQYPSLPVIGSPGSALFPWMAGNSVVDILKCTRLPSSAFDLDASLTLRSNCEVPPP
jgi:hypothetical protein